jgi:hypothetical protein
MLDWTDGGQGVKVCSQLAGVGLSPHGQPTDILHHLLHRPVQQFLSQLMKKQKNIDKHGRYIMTTCQMICKPPSKC